MPKVSEERAVLANPKPNPNPRTNPDPNPNPNPNPNEVSEERAVLARRAARLAEGEAARSAIRWALSA